MESLTKERGMIELDDHVCSNFDHEIHQDVVEKLKLTPNSFSRYPGDAFNGRVYYDEGQFHCEVWRYGSTHVTMTADTMEELKDDVCYEYGRQ